MRKHLTLALAAMLLSLGVMAQGPHTTQASQSPMDQSSVLPTLDELIRPAQKSQETPFLMGQGQQTQTQVKNKTHHLSAFEQRQAKQAEARRMLQLVLRAPQQAMAIGAPTNLSVTSDYPGFTVSWTAPTGTITGYCLIVMDADNISHLLRDTIDASATEYAIDSIFGANDYEVYLCALGQNGARSEWVSLTCELDWASLALTTLESYLIETDVHLVMSDGSEVVLHCSDRNPVLRLPDFDYLYFDVPDYLTRTEWEIDIYNDYKDHYYEYDEYLPGDRVYVENYSQGDIDAPQIDNMYFNSQNEINLVGPSTTTQLEYVLRRGTLTLPQLATAHTSYGEGTDISVPTVTPGVIYTLAVRSVSDKGRSRWTTKQLSWAMNITEMLSVIDATIGSLPLSESGKMSDLGRTLDVGMYIQTWEKGFELEEASRVHIDASMLTIHDANEMCLLVSKEAYGSSTPPYCVYTKDSVFSTDLMLGAGIWYVGVSAYGDREPARFSVDMTAEPLPVMAAPQQFTIPFAESSVLSADDACWAMGQALRIRQYSFTLTDTTHVGFLLETPQSSLTSGLIAYVMDGPLTSPTTRFITSFGMIGSNMVPTDEVLPPGTYNILMFPLSEDLLDSEPYHLLVSEKQDSIRVTNPTRLTLGRAVSASMHDKAAVSKASYWYGHQYSFTLGQETNVDIVITGDSLYTNMQGFYLTDTVVFSSVDADWYDYSANMTLPAGTYYISFYSELRDANYSIEVMEHQGWEYDNVHMTANASGSFSASNEYHRDIMLDVSPNNMCKYECGMTYTPVFFLSSSSFVVTDTHMEVAYRFKNMDKTFSRYNSDAVGVKVYSTTTTTSSRSYLMSDVIAFNGLTIGDTMIVEAWSHYHPLEVELWLLNNAHLTYQQLDVPSLTTFDLDQMSLMNYSYQALPGGRYRFYTTDPAMLTIFSDSDPYIQYGASTVSKTQIYTGSLSCAYSGDNYLDVVALDSMPYAIDIRPMDRDTDVAFTTALTLGSKKLSSHAFTEAQPRGICDPSDCFFHAYDAYKVHMEKGHQYKLAYTLSTQDNNGGWTRLMLLKPTQLTSTSADVVEYMNLSVSDTYRSRSDYFTFISDTTADYPVLMLYQMSGPDVTLTTQLEITDLGMPSNLAISVDSACNSAPELLYSQLPLRREVHLNAAHCPLVKDARVNGANWYSHVVTMRLLAGDILYAEHFFEYDSYMILYRRNSDGTWMQLGSWDDNGSYSSKVSTSEFFNYTVPSDGIYAILSCSYYYNLPDNTGMLYLAVNKIDLLELWEPLDDSDVDSHNYFYITVSDDNLFFPAGTDEAAVAARMAQLTVTLTSGYTYNLTHQVLPNTADMWRIDMQHGVAMYYVGADYPAGVVHFSVASALETISQEAGAEKFTDGQHIYIRTADGSVYNALGARVK